MNKLLIATLLSISSITGAQALPQYNCSELNQVNYEIEQLAEEAKDVQFDEKTRLQIVDEYYQMVALSNKLNLECNTKVVKYTDNEFSLNGVTYIVVTEYNTKY